MGTTGRSVSCLSGKEWRPCSCLIDGEAVCCEVDGVPSFELQRYRHHDGPVFLYVFDLLELDGRDMRPAPLEERRAALAKLLRQIKHDVPLSDHVEAEGPIVFRHACALGVEGVVSKRKGSPYRSDRTPDWVKCKNPASPAVKRETEARLAKLVAVSAADHFQLAIILTLNHYPDPSF